MWNSKTESLDNGRIQKVSLFRDGNALRYKDVAELLGNNHSFRRFFNELLANSPFSAFFWESRPVSLATYERMFEFVLADAPSLVGAPPDKQSFAAHWSENESLVVAFHNIGKDALLIAPYPKQKNLSPYAHLAAFCRSTLADQQDALWRQVGQSISQYIGTNPLWISTSGLGIYWLHIRLDSQPKYYTYDPYRRM